MALFGVGWLVVLQFMFTRVFVLCCIGFTCFTLFCVGGWYCGFVVLVYRLDFGFGFGGRCDVQLVGLLFAVVCVLVLIWVLYLICALVSFLLVGDRCLFRLILVG